MKLLRSDIILFAGSTTILLLLLGVLGLWIHDVERNKDRLIQIAKEEQSRALVSIMRDAAHRRAIALYRMTTLEDPFERDDEFVTFRAHGSIFVGAREDLTATEMTPEEALIWDKTRDMLNQGGPAQLTVADLAQEGKTDAAMKVLVTQVVPIQDQFVAEITKLFETKGKSIARQLEQATTDTNQTYFLIVILGAVAFLLVVFNNYVIRNARRSEKALMEQGQRVRRMYEVSARNGVSAEIQVVEMLKLGCELLNMDLGKVCQVNDHLNTNRIINLYSTESTSLKPEMILPLDKTLCKYIFAADRAIAVDDLRTSEFGKLENLKDIEISSYIAAPISVGGDKYGTVSFSRTRQRQSSFSEADKDIVSLIGSWISVTLERQIAQQEMRKAKDDAVVASSAKSQFLASMSHELRTPLNAVIGYSELLKDELTDIGNEQLIRDVNNISSAGKNLLALVNDVLDLSKIEAGKLEIKSDSVKLPALISEIATTMKPLALKRNNSIHCNVEQHIEYFETDATKLRQILLNLLGNACKFTENGKIILSVYEVREGGTDCVCFQVSDTGVGIAADEIGKLFEEFNQAGSTEDKRKGTGLGLAISRRLCRLLGGDISVRSEVGAGSTFTVKLPKWQQSHRQQDLRGRVA